MIGTASKTRGRRRSCKLIAGLLAIAATCIPQPSAADESGVSFWIPGFFGSLAAVPLQPGFSLTSIYYHTSVSAGSEVSRARQIRIGRIPASVAASVSAELDADADIGFAFPTYTFASPILGGQATIGLLVPYGRNSTSIDARLNAAALVGPLDFGPSGPLGPFAFSRSRFDSISESVTGFGDLVPLVSLRWNAGVHNFMTYAAGDIPVGAYERRRLANIGIGHGALDGGLGYTYLNTQNGREFSAVAGLTYNFENPDTDYQSGVDFHLDWAASQFLSKQFHVGVVGYVYHQLSCDSGSGNRVGCFKSRVASFGGQAGYIVPMGDVQGYLNFRGYKEFDAKHRPEGWNVWLSFTLSPAQRTQTAPAMMKSHMYMK